MKDVKYAQNLLDGSLVVRATIKVSKNPKVAEVDIAQLKRFGNQERQVNVISFSEAFTSKRGGKKLHIYMPFYRGSLQKLIKSSTYTSVTHREKLQIMLGMAESIAVLHRQKAGHGDIKPDNFLLDDQLQVVLNDYGGVFTPGDKNEIECCTNGYVPPECRGQNPSPRELSFDIFSLGTTFHEFLYGKRPVPGDYPIPEKDASFERRLIQDMLFKNPSKRLTIEEVISRLQNELQSLKLKRIF